uniref:LIMR family protein n=1 Tax=Spongospora subterranea TaxID=70186 RepID=A0A0H5QHD3_9EUKA|eukprot:CRZ01378.1 hypothetical protein [Spongospora subterranea]
MTDSTLYFDVVILLIVFISLAVIAVAGSVLLVIKFGHPDDKNVALLPKFVVIYSLFLAVSSVALFPIDVACRSSDALSSIIYYVWIAMFINIAAFLVIIIPLAIAFYEESSTDKSVCRSLIYGLVPLMLIGVAIAILYPFFGTNSLSPEDIQRFQSRSGWNYIPSSLSQIYSDHISIGYFGLAIMAMIGWIAFILFVPIGVAMLPIDMVRAFIHRPKALNIVEYTREKQAIGREASVLLKAAQDVGQSRKGSLNLFVGRSTKRSRKELLALEMQTYELKRRRMTLEIAYSYRGGNPLWYGLQLLLGVIYAILTIAWIVHLTLAVVVDASPALSTVLLELQKFGGTFPVFSIVAFVVLSEYLLLSAIKGSFKFSLGTAWLSIYPMEVGNTLMSAFLVNSWLILALVVPLIQFCTIAFADYVAGTVIGMIFLLRINNIRFFKGVLFYDNIYMYLMLWIFLITLLVVAVSSKGKRKEINIRSSAVVEGA